MWRDLVRDLAPSRRRARRQPDRGRGGRTSARRDGREVREDRAQLGHRGRGRGAEGAGSGNPPTCTYLMIYRSVCFLYFEEANVYMCQMDVFGCGPPRLLRLHRDTEGGRRGALRRVLTRRALGLWQTSPALASKPRGARYLDRGTTRWNSRAPASETAGPLPRRKAPGIRGILKDSIGLNPHPKSKTLRDYRSKPTIIQLVNHIRNV